MREGRCELESFWKCIGACSSTSPLVHTMSEPHQQLPLMEVVRPTPGARLRSRDATQAINTDCNNLIFPSSISSPHSLTFSSPPLLLLDFFEPPLFFFPSHLSYSPLSLRLPYPFISYGVVVVECYPAGYWELAVSCGRLREWSSRCGELWWLWSARDVMSPTTLLNPPAVRFLNGIFNHVLLSSVSGGSFDLMRCIKKGKQKMDR